MTRLDVEQLAQTLTSEEPCGPDLSYDPLFGELERAAQGKPEQQFGDTLIPAEPPAWNVVRDKAMLLCQRTKDLRVLLLLLQAELYLQGLVGFAQTLEALTRVLEQHWPHLHPELDPDDAYDPTLRLNTLATLVAPSLLQALREVPLVSSRRLGRYSFRDVQIALGQAAAPEGEDELPNLATIEGAFLDAESGELEQTLDAPARALASLRQLESVLEQRVDGIAIPDFSALRTLLESIQNYLNEQGLKRGLGDTPSHDGPGNLDSTEPRATAEVPAQAPRGIQRREDVIRMLDEICDYFRRQEPSSPVPILLQRAKSLVSKDFMEILRDLTPDAVSQAEVFRGGSNE